MSDQVKTTTRVLMVGALALAALAAGCDNVSVDNANPLGTVGGMLIDASNEMPLAGANVQIVSATVTLTTTSDANGLWKVEKVPAGNFIISFSASGYTTATFNSVLAGNVGNLPVKNPSLTLGPLGLLPNSGSFQVRLVNDQGAPAANVSASLRLPVRWMDFSNGYPQGQGSFSVEATSDAQGMVTFSSIPDFTLLKGNLGSAYSVVQVAPQKVMGSGGQYYSFFGIIMQWDLSQLPSDSNVLTITLSGPRSDLNILDTNISYLKLGQYGSPDSSTIPAAGPITVAFNQAIDPTSVRAFLTDELGKQSAGLPPLQASTNLNVLSITPMGALKAGARYHLNLRVLAAGTDNANISGRDRTYVAPFFVASMAPVTVVDAKRDPNSGVVTVNFSEPIGLGRTTQVPPSLPCVAYWESPVDFDGLVTNYFAEYVAIPQNLACYDYGLNLPQDVPPSPYLPTVTPVEPPVPGYYIGFSSRWTFNANANGCRNGFTSCRAPGSGDKVHFVFSLQPASQTVRRFNGDLVGDNLAVTVQ